jgi:hypothetical protein
VSVDSWQETGVFVPPTPAEASFGLVTGCDKLSFHPSLAVAPDSAQAAAPSGYGVSIESPQNENPEGLATPAVRDVTVSLPTGTSISSSAADGLQACSEEQVGLRSVSPVVFSTEPVSCPEASQIGTVQVETPLLSKPLTGSAYIAQQNTNPAWNTGAPLPNANPFGSLFAMYIVAEGSGVRLKLAGEMHADPVTGQLTATFRQAPQQPFSVLSLHLNGGSRAPLANPTQCGEAVANALLVPYSGGVPAALSSAFKVEGCPAPRFDPSFLAETTSNQAGGFSPFAVAFSRTDQDQDLAGLSVKAPPGLLGILKSVPLCPEPAASTGACGSESMIGHVTVGSGPGTTPLYLGGRVFLTGPYAGAPFGLSIVVPAKAGPFDLGNVVVRARIDVDPETSQIVITSDPLPQIIDGIPLQVKVVNVVVDRPGFMFNPTSCSVKSVEGTLASTQGALAKVSSRFQAAGCQGLPFKPSFTVSSQAKTSRREGASLHVRIAYPSGTQANIRSVAVSLPKQLPARLSTIQQACPDSTFNANPAACPAGSLIGTGTAATPVLAQPLTGPVYLVSHGGAAFPDIVMILQGQNVRVDLTGSINIAKNGITSSTFASVPDVPIASFDLVLPEGPHSALSATGSLCAKPLTMPTTIDAQNGAQIAQKTKINITGCKKKAKKAKTHNARRAHNAHNPTTRP